MSFSEMVIRSYLDDSDQIQQIRAGYGITDQELRFVLELIVDFDYSRAFSTIFPVEELDPFVASHKLASRPEILKAISTELSIQGASLTIKKDTIMMGIFKEAINPKAKPGERLKAYELLARMIGDLDPTDKNKIPSINVNIVDNRAIQLTNDKVAVNLSVGIDGSPVIDVEPESDSNE